MEAGVQHALPGREYAIPRPVSTDKVFNEELNGKDFGGKGRVDAEFYLVRWVRDEPSWIKKCAPLFVKTRSVLCNDTFFGFLTLRGSVMADTPFSHLPGKPSIMVDGIMPTTVLCFCCTGSGLLR